MIKNENIFMNQSCNSLDLFAADFESFFQDSDEIEIEHNEHHSSLINSLDENDDYYEQLLLSACEGDHNSFTDITGEDESLNEHFQNMLNEWASDIGSFDDSDELFRFETLPNNTCEMKTDTVVDNDTEVYNGLENTMNSIADPVSKEAPASKPHIHSVTPNVGVVISAGPGGHFETYEVFNDDSVNSCGDNSPTVSKQIHEAVRRHFGGNPNLLRSNDTFTPKIVRSQRIKDALPKEVIDNIVLSSLRTRMIAIIQPVVTSDKDSTSNNFHHSMKGSSKFQAAAFSLSRNKLKHVGLPVSPKFGMNSGVLFDHDYCSPKKPKKGGRITSTRGTLPPRTKLFRNCSESSYWTPNKSPIKINLESSYFPPFSCFSPTLSSPGSNCEITDSKKDSGLESGNVSEEDQASTRAEMKSPEIVKKKLTLDEYRARRQKLDESIFKEKTASVGVSNIASKSEVKKKSFLNGEGSLPKVQKNYEERTTTEIKSRFSNSSKIFSQNQRSNLYQRWSKRTAAPRSEIPRQFIINDSTSSLRRQSSCNGKRKLSNISTPDRNKRPKLSSSIKRRNGRCFSRDDQLVEQDRRRSRQETERQVEDRRIVYVGRLSDGTCRSDLYRRFEIFGPIIDVSIHFRTNAYNYGFVTFRNKVDAFEAIEKGNDDPAYPNVTLSFGGRRSFCQQKYSDLDSVDETNSFYNAYRPRCGDIVEQNTLTDEENSLNFDELLRLVRASKRK